MTAPYTQQNYANWKKRLPQESAIAGLLNQAKQVAGMAEEPPPALLQPTPPFNPNEGRSTPAGDDPTHAHRKGLLGGLRHLVGADRTAPEVAALLTPDQQARVRPGLLSTVYNAVVEGKGPQEVQRERARTMLDLSDEKVARDRAARQQAMVQRIQDVAAKLPPYEAVEYASRMYAAMGLAPAEQASRSADVTRPRAPMMAARGTAVQKPDGSWEIPSPIPEAQPSVVQVNTRGASGQGVIRSVNETTGQVYWEMPAPPDNLSPGFGRPPTEAESKDYVFAGLMRNAMPDIRATAEKVRPEVITAIRMDPLGITKMELSDDERVFWRAVLEFAAAANRKESGAAITPSEVSNTLDRYVDTGFDGPANSPVRKAKARARENYLNLLDRTSARARAYYDGVDGEEKPSDKTITRAEYNQLSPAAQQAALAGGYTIRDR